MELSLKSITLLGTLLLTGLSAGFFYAWAVSVIPGNLNVNDSSYLESMQSINRAILNPRFFVVFFGPVLLLILSTIFQFNGNKIVFWFMLFAALSYIVGAFGITIAGNVPLNDQLDVLNLSQLSPQEIADFRTHYEIKWNKLHMQRTLFAVLSFLLFSVGLFLKIYKP